MAYTTIDDPLKYFNITLWTGNDTDDRAITGLDFQPDFVWIKDRIQDGNYHDIYDSNRGATKRIFPNTDDHEQTQAAGLKSFNSNGYTLGTNSDVNANSSSNTYVGWSWKANGGTTSSNTNGDITSTVQTNSTAGFSIVTYTGNGTAGQTVGHGLSSQPDMIIVKKRAGGTAYGWGVWHTSLSNNNGTKQLILETTAAEATQDMFNDAIFPSDSATVFAIGANNHTNHPSGATYVAYCFNEVKGYSKFGKYKGNNNANGPFVYLGFKPAFLIMKETSGTGNWAIIDSTRSTHNVGNHTLAANLASNEAAFGDGASSGGDYNKIDLVSNGFKIREASAYNNGADDDYIYMAFAENPFVTSTGVPTTAR